MKKYIALIIISILLLSSINVYAKNLENISKEKAIQGAAITFSLVKIIDYLRESNRNKEIKKINHQERKLLEKLVTAEAGGESLKGKIAVASVVLNRVKSKEFPDSIKKVIYQKKQFQPVTTGKINKVSITNEVKKAVEKALEGNDVSKGALYFYNPDKSSKQGLRWFAHREKIIAIGNHIFLK